MNKNKRKERAGATQPKINYAALFVPGIDKRVYECLDRFRKDPANAKAIVAYVGKEACENEEDIVKANEATPLIKLRRELRALGIQDEHHLTAIGYLTAAILLRFQPEDGPVGGEQKHPLNPAAI